ncbi:MAG TPA: M48 family metalloprotease [Vicinamibacterales bacterium]|nr:M48 family metalloprotease [Vicinamibacterales bacterium]
MLRVMLVAFVVFVASPLAGFAQRVETVAGYAEWRKGDALIVDGQRIVTDAATRYSGGAGADAASLPLGSEVKVRGVRLPDGSVLARSIEAKRNGHSPFERMLHEEADAMERQWLRQRQVDDPDDPDAGGPILDRGRHVSRVQRLFGRLVPPYLSAGDFRVHVVDNDEWNAFAMPNGSIWVFTGLLDAMDDDEVAVVLGHELAHITHEHGRRNSKKSLWTSVLAGVIGLAAEQIESDTLRTVAQVATYGSALAVDSAFGRDAEDQADRVGLRYAFEAGFDVRKAPGVWQRFEEKYGAGNRVVNFFLSDHSRAPVRRAHLEQQIAWNYRPGLDISTAAAAWRAATESRRATLHASAPAAAPTDDYASTAKQAVLVSKGEMRRRQ